MPKRRLEKAKAIEQSKKIFAERLRRAKSDRNLKNKDIVERAKKLNFPISESSVSQAMNGRLIPDNERVYIWSKILNVDPVWLMGFTSLEPVPVNDSVPGSNLEYIRIRELFQELTAEQQSLLIKIAEQFALSASKSVCNYNPDTEENK